MVIIVRVSAVALQICSLFFSVSSVLSVANIRSSLFVICENLRNLRILSEIVVR